MGRALLHASVLLLVWICVVRLRVQPRLLCNFRIFPWYGRSSSVTCFAASERVQALADLEDFAKFPDGSAVALGKFDAVHKGHGALAAVASAASNSAWLLTFHGMAEVLGWERRLPLIAPELRTSVLQGYGVRERSLPFADIRSLAPDEFVDLLANVLSVKTVVCGANYRFGYRAAGDARLLQALGKDAGLRIEVVDLLSDGTGTTEVVSSTAVRESLARGDVDAAARYLGRRHAVVWTSLTGNTLQSPRNQPPADGIYKVKLAQSDFQQLQRQQQQQLDALVEVKGGSAKLEMTPEVLPSGGFWMTTFTCQS